MVLALNAKNLQHNFLLESDQDNMILYKFLPVFFLAIPSDHPKIQDHYAGGPMLIPYKDTYEIKQYYPL